MKNTIKNSFEDCLLKKKNSFEDCLLNKIALAYSVIAIPVVLFSIMRIYKTGWIPVYSINLFLLPLVIALGIFREKIKTRTKAWFLIFTFFIISIFAFKSLSISSQAVPLLMLSVLFSSVFLNKFNSILVFISSVAVIIIFGYLNISGLVSPYVDLNKYPNHFSSWLNIVSVFSLLLGFFVFILTRIQNKYLADLREANSSLEKALEEIRVLKGIIPICSYCKEIRNDAGVWSRLEEYIEEHSDAEFSHGICPKCMAEKFPNYAIKSDSE